MIQSQAASPASPLDGKLLTSIPELKIVTGLCERYLRSLDASGDIPGRVRAGRRVLFQTEIIREWIRAGMPDREQWALLTKQNKR